MSILYRNSSKVTQFTKIEEVLYADILNFSFVDIGKSYRRKYYRAKSEAYR